MCRVFAEILGVNQGSGALVFFKIRDTLERGRIVSELLDRKFGDQCSEFRKSIKTQYNKLSEVRNRIVHWAKITIVSGADGEMTVALSRPDYWWEIGI